VNPALTIDNSPIFGDRTIEQLHRFRLLPQLLNEIAIDDLVAEMAVAWSIDLDWNVIEFEQKYTDLAKSPFYQGMNERQLAAICDRELRLQKFKLAKWGDEVKVYFQDRGNGLVGAASHPENRVVLSVLQVERAALAQELFFRIQAQEQSFAEIALDYSQDIHADNGGILESLMLRDLNPALRVMVAKLQPGDLSPIFRLDDYYTFFRLDEWQPAQLDGQMYRFLLDELFTTWLESKLADRCGQMMNPRLLSDIHPPEPPLQSERILDRLSKSPLLFTYLREVIIEETLALWERSTEFTLVGDLVPLDDRNRPVALLQLYKQTEWGHLLNSRFLARKAQLDRVLFSAIQVTDLHLAEELYCSLRDRRHSFAKLASLHSQSPAATRGGSIGPVTIYQLHPVIQQHLIGLEPKQFSPIFQLDEYYVLLRLDRWLPVEFNLKIQQQLLDELFAQWVRTQIDTRIGRIQLTIAEPLIQVPQQTNLPDELSASNNAPDLTPKPTETIAPTSSFFFAQITPTEIARSSFLPPQELPTQLKIDRDRRHADKIYSQVATLTIWLCLVFGCGMAGSYIFGGGEHQVNKSSVAD
jgi:hypothetical protein